MNKWMLGLAPVLLLVALGGCRHDDDGKVAEAIAKRNLEMGEAAAKGDSAAMAAMYSADAVLMPPNLPRIKGAENIQKLWQGFIDSGVKGLRLTSTEVESHGDTADEEGTYAVLGAEGKVLETGKYIVIWKHDNGSWLLRRDIWNSDAPPPMAAPAAAPAEAATPAPALAPKP